VNNGRPEEKGHSNTAGNEPIPQNTSIDNFQPSSLSRYVFTKPKLRSQTIPKEGTMKSILKILLLSVASVALQPIVRASPDTPLDSAKSKLQQDMKAAVLDEALTIPQLKELQASVATLKAAREAHHPGDPVDLLTCPYK
jgi:hypothetical protein